MQTAFSISVTGLWLPCTGEVVDRFLDAVEIRPRTDGAVARLNLPTYPVPIKILEGGRPIFLTGADINARIILIMLLTIT